ncbi:hypothetical protein IDH14_04870 [Pelagibacterales bacterium SAG-MED33]|nr:hypothetical protein [Pelagibacterales bacterium SAG-MED33]
MLNFLVVGFGKIGSEHLKAIKKIKLKKKIWIFDPFINEKTSFSKKTSIFRVNKIKKIPNRLKVNLLIMSGLSKDRYLLTNKILKKVSAKNVLFEKTVFSKSNQIKLFINSKLFKMNNMYVNTWKKNIFSKFDLSFLNYNDLNIKVELRRENYLNNLCHLLEVYRVFINGEKLVIKSNEIKNLVNYNNLYSVCDGKIVLNSKKIKMTIKTKKVKKGNIELSFYSKKKLIERIVFNGNFEIFHIYKKNNIKFSKKISFPKIKNTTYEFINRLNKKQKVDLTLLKDHYKLSYKMIKNFENLNKKIMFK